MLRIRTALVLTALVAVAPLARAEAGRNDQ